MNRQTPQEVYIVTSFGCNSGYNEMWPPKSKLFLNAEEAYEYYLSIKPIEYIEEGKTEDGSRYAIQNGDDVKRPDGAIIQKFILNLP